MNFLIGIHLFLKIFLGISSKDFYEHLDRLSLSEVNFSFQGVYMLELMEIYFIFAEILD